MFIFIFFNTELAEGAKSALNITRNKNEEEGGGESWLLTL